MNGQTPSPAPMQAVAPRRGWFGRNWRWFVPLGCLSMIALVAVFIVGIVTLVFGVMKSSDVYKDAVAQAKNHPAVIEALGAPVRDGLIVSGKTNTEGSSGEAELSIPLIGSKGKGTLHVVANKSAGEWKYSKLVVEVARTGERINLMEGSDTETL